MHVLYWANMSFAEAQLTAALSALPRTTLPKSKPPCAIATWW